MQMYLNISPLVTDPETLQVVFPVTIGRRNNPLVVDWAMQFIYPPLEYEAVITAVAVEFVAVAVICPAIIDPAIVNPAEIVGDVPKL